MVAHIIFAKQQQQQQQTDTYTHKIKIIFRLHETTIKIAYTLHRKCESMKSSHPPMCRVCYDEVSDRYHVDGFIEKTNNNNNTTNKNRTRAKHGDAENSKAKTLKRI